MESSHVTLSVLVLTFASVSFALYLISDYYMDDDWPRSFGQVCGQTVGDDCAYINSHLNTFGIINYDSDISCTMMLDAGKQRDARYKFTWKRFDLETGPNCTYDSITLYNARINNISSSNVFGTFCGSDDPNTTGFMSQQYATLKFRTDGGTNKKGFRLMVTRTVPYPCPGDDYFYCKSENRCIDGRLQCDGTVQCEDETDEDDCSFWEKLLGGILALGVAGIIGITGTCLFFCISVGVIICICTCCRKQCDCLFRGCNKCWTVICSPVKDKLGKLKSAKVSAVDETADTVELVKVDETGNCEDNGGSDDQNIHNSEKKAKNTDDVNAVNGEISGTVTSNVDEQHIVAGNQASKTSGDAHIDNDKVLSREKTVTPRDAVIGIVNVETDAETAQTTEKSAQAGKNESIDGQPPDQRPVTSSKTGRQERISLAQDGGENTNDGVTKVDAN